jgi:hypothetical protein
MRRRGRRQCPSRDWREGRQVSFHGGLFLLFEGWGLLLGSCAGAAFAGGRGDGFVRGELGLDGWEGTSVSGGGGVAELVGFGGVFEGRGEVVVVGFIVRRVDECHACCRLVCGGGTETRRFVERGGGCGGGRLRDYGKGE